MGPEDGLASCERVGLGKGCVLWKGCGLGKGCGCWRVCAHGKGLWTQKGKGPWEEFCNGILMSNIRAPWGTTKQLSFVMSFLVGMFPQLP